MESPETHSLSSSPHPLISLLQPALSRQDIRSIEPLTGGANTRSFRVHCRNADSFVLKLYPGQKGAFETESKLLSTLSSRLPTPELLHAAAHSEFGPYILYRYANGVTFQELKSKAPRPEIAEAASAVGEVLAAVHATPQPGLQRRQPSPEGFLESRSLHRRLGSQAANRLQRFLQGHLSRIANLQEHNALVHGDFNNRNVILKQQYGRWAVSAILDWEQAYQGSPLWDVARFICNEHPAAPCREPHFTKAYVSAGGTLPPDWHQIALALNLLGVAEALSSDDLPSRFIPELCDLANSAPQ